MNPDEPIFYIAYPAKGGTASIIKKLFSCLLPDKFILRLRMRLSLFYSTWLLLAVASCSDAQVVSLNSTSVPGEKKIVVGAERTDQYLPVLSGKRVAVVANQSSLIGNTHLVDSLLAHKINVKIVFAPEHGFRGEAGAGETIADSHDTKTGLPVISLYGKTKKPTPIMLQNVDIVVFDIQDVGARFYTYISTLHYVMQACAENGKFLLILDRPNPNGFYVDGPVLEEEFKSFVGMHPIPVVHGCTVGELAKMIEGEQWLETDKECRFVVVSCLNYEHSMHYELPVAPSPNLPNRAAVYLYPSLCFFEGTMVSVGRGTDLPFQCIGYPGNTTGKFEFTPADAPHKAMDPLYEGKLCTGHDLAAFGDFYFAASKQLYLEWLTGLYDACLDKKNFFTSPSFFDQLAGTGELRKQLTAGLSGDEIRQSWQNELGAYKIMRKKYLLYPDFE